MDLTVREMSVVMIITDKPINTAICIDFAKRYRSSFKYRILANFLYWLKK